MLESFVIGYHIIKASVSICILSGLRFFNTQQLDIAVLGHNLFMQMQKMPERQKKIYGAGDSDSTNEVANPLFPDLKCGMSHFGRHTGEHFPGTLCCKENGTYKAELYQIAYLDVLKSSPLSLPQCQPRINQADLQYA